MEIVTMVLAGVSLAFSVWEWWRMRKVRAFVRGFERGLQLGAEERDPG